MHHIRTLVVDDIPDHRELMVLMLQDVGFSEVDVASDGKQAAGLLQKHYYQLAVIDYDMPCMNGFDLSFSIKKITPQTCILLVSGADISDLQLMSQPVDGFLRKPFDLDQLLPVLEYILETSL